MWTRSDHTNCMGMSPGTCKCLKVPYLNWLGLNLSHHCSYKPIGRNGGIAVKKKDGIEGYVVSSTPRSLSMRLALTRRNGIHAAPTRRHLRHWHS
jgi:hypothetical protein